jgi:hypothetical protein
MASMSMCLGARVVTVTNQLSSSSNAGDRATILMEFKDANDAVLEIRLSIGTKTYSSSVLFPDVSDIFGGNKESSDGGDTTNTSTTATRMIEFGRHFLRVDPSTTSDNEGNNQDEKSSSETKFDSIIISFEYDNDNHTNGGIDEDEENTNTTKDINLIIREKLQHGMMKIILRSKMKKVVGELSYCIAIGETLNKAIDEVRKLKSQVSMWKKTAEDLDRTQQDNKDTLLANFTKLRNFLNEKYQKELEELKLLHEEEKKTWKKESSSIATATKKVRTKRKDDPVQDYEELFEGENQIDCLAEGRKTTRTKHRKAILKEPIDMVGIQREEQEYNNKKSRSKSNKRKKPKKVHQPLSSTDDDDDDDDDITVDSDNCKRSSNGKKRKKIKQPPTRHNEDDDDNDDDNKIVYSDSDNGKKSSNGKKRKKVKQSFSARHDDNNDDETISGESDNGKKSSDGKKRQKVEQPLPARQDDDDDDDNDDGWTVRRAKIEIPSSQTKTKAAVPAVKDDASVSSESSWKLR